MIFINLRTGDDKHENLFAKYKNTEFYIKG